MDEPARDVRVLLQGHFLLAGQRPPAGTVADECGQCGSPVSVVPLEVPGVLAAIRCIICYRDVLAPA